MARREWDALAALAADIGRDWPVGAGAAEAVRGQRR
jgi:hypothetical protein